MLLQHGPESDGGEDEPGDEEEDVEERERELEAGDPAAAVGAAADVHVPAAALLEKGCLCSEIAMVNRCHILNRFY